MRVVNRENENKSEFLALRPSITIVEYVGIMLKTLEFLFVRDIV